MRLSGSGFLLAASFSACDPQVVDAVDFVGNGGSAGESTAGTGGTDAAGSAGSPPCIDTDDPDGDGFANCEDACPNQPLKQVPGTCGCAIPDEDSEDVASCIPLRGALAHRYSFNVPGAGVRDSVLHWDANIVGAVAADGAVLLGGADSGEYVNLHNGILSKLTSVTLEAWLTWAGGSGEWQRVFDFGDDQSMVEGNRSTGRTYLFMTPMVPVAETPFARVAFLGPSVPREASVTATRALRSGTAVHVAFTFDDTEKRLALYIDGELDVEKTLDPTDDAPMSLSMINDINCWLGRSQFTRDADFGGSIDEFRIYSSALTALQVRTSNLAGPDPEFLP
jgi:hypothetical protein